MGLLAPHYQPMQPGDVAAVHTSGKVIAPLIRFGQLVAGLPHTVNHVVVAHHWDGDRLVGVEADPRGGVQWVDVDKYDNLWFLHNADQPKTDEQRAAVCRYAVALLRAPYDWVAIAWDALTMVGLKPPGRYHAFGNDPPPSVVCSSFASWLYRKAGLPEPGSVERWTTPGNWAAWIQARGWQVTAVDRRETT